MHERSRISLLIVVFLLIVGAIVFLEKDKVRATGDMATLAVDAVPTALESTTTEVVSTSSDIKTGVKTAALSSAEKLQKAAQYSRAKEIANPSGFLNTSGKPITIGGLLEKKVVLVDFWTYSCINCQRTLPYLNAWYEKYKDKGLEIVSIHTPEFDFEKDAANVAKAAKKFGVQYPIVQDNDYGTWSAYGNRYWPRKYLIDIDGYVVYDHIGEGSYEETEMRIKELLEERAARLGIPGDIDSVIAKPANVVSISKVGSPETYFGSARNEFLANGAKGRAGEAAFVLPEKQSLNGLYFDGTWNIMPEYAESLGQGKIVYRFKAKNVYLVAAGSVSGLRATILLDGKPIVSGGVDVSNGAVSVSGHQLYHLVSLPGDAEEHTLEIDVPSGFLAYAFTFG